MLVAPLCPAKKTTSVHPFNLYNLIKAVYGEFVFQFVFGYLGEPELLLWRFFQRVGMFCVCVHFCQKWGNAAD